jgi:hypothetical protein
MKSYGNIDARADLTDGRNHWKDFRKFVTIQVALLLSSV